MEIIASLSMYPWPYSYKCGKCKTGIIKDNICQNCGADYRMKSCPECDCYYARAWDEGGGCPACQGIISKPLRK